MRSSCLLNPIPEQSPGRGLSLASLTVSQDSVNFGEIEYSQGNEESEEVWTRSLGPNFAIGAEPASLEMLRSPTVRWSNYIFFGSVTLFASNSRLIG